MIVVKITVRDPSSGRDIEVEVEKHIAGMSAQHTIDTMQAAAQDALDSVEGAIRA